MRVVRTKELLRQVIKGIPAVEEERQVRFSASTLYDFCARREAILAEDRGPQTIQRLSSDGYVLSIGQAYHEAMQSHFLGPLGLVLGSWRCLRCGSVSGSYKHLNLMVPMPESCFGCDSPKRVDRDLIFRYVENEIVDERTSFVCHPDGYDPDRRIWEFKSASVATDLDVWTAPLPAHVVQVQANLYMHFLRYGEMTSGRLVYLSKSHSTMYESVNEYQIPYDPDFPKGRYWKRVREYAKYLKDGSRPSRPCKGPGCKRAQSCEVVDLCFGD